MRSEGGRSFDELMSLSGATTVVEAAIATDVGREHGWTTLSLLVRAENEHVPGIFGSVSSAHPSSSVSDSPESRLISVSCYLVIRDCYLRRWTAVGLAESRSLCMASGWPSYVSFVACPYFVYYDFCRHVCHLDRLDFRQSLLNRLGNDRL